MYIYALTHHTKEQLNSLLQINLNPQLDTNISRTYICITSTELIQLDISYLTKPTISHYT